MAKKLVYTTNTPSATTDYAAADGTWKTMGGGGGGGTVTGCDFPVISCRMLLYCSVFPKGRRWP